MVLSEGTFPFLCKGCQAWLNKTVGGNEHRAFRYSPEQTSSVQTMAASRSEFEARLRRGIVVEEAMQKKLLSRSPVNGKISLATLDGNPELLFDERDINAVHVSDNGNVITVQLCDATFTLACESTPKNRQSANMLSGLKIVQIAAEQKDAFGHDEAISKHLNQAADKICDIDEFVNMHKFLQSI